MTARIGADALVLIHFAFIVFVAAGGFLVLRWHWLALLHLPSALWGALMEIAGWTCPLTGLELELRAAAGSAGYTGGFIEHYVIPLIYPPGLTQGARFALGLIVIGVNFGIYGYLAMRRRVGTRPVRDTSPAPPGARAQARLAQQEQRDPID